MGAGNVKAVYALWRDVPDPAFRLLVFMALTAKDEDDPPQFWGGRETLALGIGRNPPFTESDFRAVDRAMGKLRAAGAIVQSRHSSKMLTARHDLCLSITATPDATRRVSEVVEDVITLHAASGDHPTPGDGITRRPTTDHPTPGDGSPDAPRRGEEEEDEEGLTPGRTTHQTAQPQGVARTWQRPHPGPARCRHGLNGGMRVLGIGDAASRLCHECEEAAPAVEAAALLEPNIVVERDVMLPGVSEAS